jgi:hypothetical protein
MDNRYAAAWTKMAGKGKTPKHQRATKMRLSPQQRWLCCDKNYFFGWSHRCSKVLVCGAKRDALRIGKKQKRVGPRAKNIARLSPLTFFLHIPHLYTFACLNIHARSAQSIAVYHLCRMTLKIMGISCSDLCSLIHTLPSTFHHLPQRTAKKYHYHFFATFLPFTDFLKPPFVPILLLCAVFFICCSFFPPRVSPIQLFFEIPVFSFFLDPTLHFLLRYWRDVLTTKKLHCSCCE